MAPKSVTWNGLERRTWSLFCVILPISVANWGPIRQSGWR